jgi:hypothetical protein
MTSPIFDQANLAQALLECFDERHVVCVRGRTIGKEPKPNWTFMLLRARDNRPSSCRAAD